MNVIPPCRIFLQQGGIVVEKYDVLKDSIVVGFVNVIREGLYLRFQCRCKSFDSEIYRLIAYSGSQPIDLGICVPEGNYIILNKKMPVKVFCEMPAQFTLKANNTSTQTVLATVDPQQPFRLIDQLPLSKLDLKDGKYRIILQANGFHQ